MRVPQPESQLEHHREPRSARAAGTSFGSVLSGPPALEGSAEVASTPAELSRAEGRLFRLLAQPLPARLAANAARTEDPGVAPLASWVVADDEDEAARKVELYARMHFGRLRDSLKEDYPGLFVVLGARSFERLASEFAQQRRSQEPSLRNFSRPMAEFLRGHPAGRAFPELVDLCRLDFARIEAFDAADTVPLTEADLVTLPAESFAQLELHPSPALRLLSLDYEVTALWSAVDAGEPIVPAPRQPTTVAVWRRGYTVLLRTVDEVEAGALRALIRGITFADLCAAVDDGIGAQSSAHAAVALLRQWLVDEIIDARGATAARD